MKFDGGVIDRIINVFSSRLFISMCFIVLCLVCIVSVFNVVYKTSFNANIIHSCFYKRSQLQEKSLTCKDGLQCDMYKYSLAQYKCEEAMIAINK